MVLWIKIFKKLDTQSGKELCVIPISMKLTHFWQIIKMHSSKKKKKEIISSIESISLLVRGWNFEIFMNQSITVFV